MTLYATLAEARTENKATNTVDDDALVFNLRAVSRRIDSLLTKRKRPFFAPYIETRTVPLRDEQVEGNINVYWLQDHLLALSSLTYNETSMVLNTDYALYPSSTAPLRGLRLKSWSKSWDAFVCCNENYPVPILSIAGTWGYHDDYANAWLSVDTLSAGINSSTTTLTVADVDGDNAYGEAPRISAGHLLKIDDEYLEVIATNTGTNAVTVRRGVNGSTAAAHASGDTVFVWRVMDEIRRVTARQAAMLYARRGAYEIVSQSEIGVTTQYPQDLLLELLQTVQGYMYA